jgi:hypothetical protein
MVGDLLLTNGYYLKFIWGTSQVYWSLLLFAPLTISVTGRFCKRISGTKALWQQGVLICRCLLFCV